MLFINTTNPLKKKAINRVLNINDDKLEEIINIIDMLNVPEIKVEDIRKVKFFLWGYASQKKTTPKKIILKVHTTKRKGWIIYLH